MHGCGESFYQCIFSWIFFTRFIHAGMHKADDNPSGYLSIFHDMRFDIRMLKLIGPGLLYGFEDMGFHKFIFIRG